MAFNHEYLTRIGGGGKGSSIWTYKTEDEIQTVGGADYFQDAWQKLKLGDALLVMQVTGLDTNSEQPVDTRWYTISTRARNVLTVGTLKFEGDISPDSGVDLDDPIAAPGIVSFTSADFAYEEGAGQVNVTVQRLGGSDGLIRVDVVDMLTGTATADTDYDGFEPITLEWADGDADPKTASINLTGTVASGDRTIAIAIDEPYGFPPPILGQQNTATLTITDTPTLSSPWSKGDIGSPAIAGDAFDDGSILTNQASGDINGPVDKGHMVYQAKSTDHEIIAEVKSIGGASQHSAAGVMIRQSLDEGAPYVWMRISNHVSLNIRFQRRETADAGDLFQQVGFTTLPDFVRLVKSGNDFSAYIGPSESGPWTQVGDTQTVVMTGSPLYGIASCSTDDAELAAATFNMPALVENTANGVLQFSAVAYNYTEGDGSVDVTLTRTDGGSGAVSVEIYDTGNGTAVSDTDYNAITPTVVNWGDGDTANKTFAVNLTGTATTGSRYAELGLRTVTGGATIGAKILANLNIGESSVTWAPQFIIDTIGFDNYAPGHWEFIGTRKNNGVASEAKSLGNSGFKGVKVRYSWKEIHTGVNTFDFSDIESDIATLAADGKKLWIMIELIQWNGSSSPQVPAWMWGDSDYGGGNQGPNGEGPYYGTFWRDVQNNGWYPHWGNANVRTAYAALMTALGAAYNNHPTVEGIVAMSESAYRRQDAVNPTMTCNDWETAYKANANAAKAAFPNKIRNIMINFACWDEADVAANWAPTNGFALGTPDSYFIPSKQSVRDNIFPAIKTGDDYPNGPDVQWANYPRNFDEAGLDVAAFYALIKTEMDPSYVFWRNREPYWTNEVLPIVAAGQPPRAQLFYDNRP